MGPIANDARMLNMAETISKQYDYILLIGIYSKNIEQIHLNSNIDIIAFDLNMSMRMRSLWIKFYQQLETIKPYLKADYVWAMDLMSVPYIVHRFKKSYTLYDSREIYSDLGENVNQPLQSFALGEIERFYIKKVNQVFSSGQLDSELLAERYNLEAIPPVVHNVPYLREIEQTNEFRNELGLKEQDKLIIYQGMLAIGRGLFKLIEVLKLLPSNFHVCFIGLGALGPELKNYAKELKVDQRVFIKKPVPYHHLPKITSQADFGYTFIEPLTKSLELALPNKLFEYAHAGIPSIASDLPQMKSVIEKFKSGILFNTEVSERVIAKCIESMLQDDEQYAELQEGAYNLKMEFNWQSQESLIYQLF